jgi:hypothetical protein
LRSLDAIHLASALELGDELDAFVTYDARQTDAEHRTGCSFDRRSSFTSRRCEKTAKRRPAPAPGLTP